MTQVYYSEQKERELIPQGKYQAIWKYEGKALGRDFKATDPDKKKVQIHVVIQLDRKKPDGERRYEKHYFFTPSLHPKSGLRKFLTEWRGTDFTEAQIEAFKTNPFDIGRMVGSAALIKITHVTGESGKVSDQITGIDAEITPNFSVEWYQDQREKWTQEVKDAEAFEVAQRKVSSGGYQPRDEEDTTDYSAEPQFP